MKYNKLSAFTLAEIMVLLLTLSILMAAFAPVFTRRYSNVTSDEVWTYIAGDQNYNAYFDTPNKMYKNQAFIGLQPRDTASVDDLVKEGTNPLYSKVVIGASHRLGNVSGTPPQQQMQFRYGDSSMGTLVATLFAGNKNMLLGGPFKNIKDTANGENTSFGINTLEELTSGMRNTAVGAYALNSVTEGTDNTGIGYRAGSKITEGYGNTIVGTNAGSDTSSTLIYNTIVGYEAGRYLRGSGNTVIGNYALSSEGSQFGNTAVGYNALKNAKGNYNTAVGVNSLMNMVNGDYNTAIGFNSCNFIGYSSSSAISKITCIGANSAKVDKSSVTGGAGLPSGSNTPDRVFIGAAPKYASSSNLTSNNQKPFAVLEVHNTTKGPNENLKPKGGGEESVIINGNLVVRGRTYLEQPIFRAHQQGRDDPNAQPKGLVLMRLHYNVNKSGLQVFSGFDGQDRTVGSHQTCNGCQQHAFADIRPNCICTAVGPDYSSNTSFAAGVKEGDKRYSSTSYDWYSKAGNMNSTNKSCESDTSYKDLSTGTNIGLAHNPSLQSYSGDNENTARETDKPYAHLNGYSCCPNLSSDIRLKNVGEKFTAGLEEIKKLNVYNFTFKNDVNRLPQVGVIAQDLKTVFPKAVTKGKDGYYRIRWSEMLYAAVNAVKTLNSKIEALASRIATDKERVATLKRDNAQMYAQLDKLADELEALEAKKK